MVDNPSVVGYHYASMHNQSDQFIKNILREVLSRASVADTEVEVVAATQKIDVYSTPDPAREAERDEMGLLGELSAEPCLFEGFRNTPSLRHARPCIRKQLTWHHELELRARAAARSAAADADFDGPLRPAVPFPALVMIGPGRPETVLEAYGCKQVRPGLYHAVPGLVMRVVVLSELPRTRETLLLRLLGKGRHLKNAIADLEALPMDAWEKSIATPLLVRFRIEIVEAGIDEEDDMSAEIQAWFENYQQELRSEGRQEGLQEGRREGRQEGRQEGERNLLLRQLRARFGELPEIAVARIDAADVADLERWGERVLGAQTLAEVLDDRS